MRTGEQAVDQVESLMDKPSRVWLEIHGSRADRTAWIYYATAVLAAAGVVLPRYVSKSAPFLLWAVFFTGALALGAGVWIASAGGKIRHSEFRISVDPSAGIGN
jgi:hypothetical protein